MKRNLFLAAFLICQLTFSPVLLYSQSREIQPGFLWRITGKGLKDTSYLYGTFHLPDKRLFNFPDSLYTVFESCKGYASELDVDSMMTFFMNQPPDPEDMQYVKDVLAAKEYNSIKKKLQEKFHKPADVVKASEFRDYVSGWKNYIVDSNRTETAMDFYFYSIAKRKDKWVGGIEDLDDQRKTDKKVPLKEYITEFLDENKKTSRYIEDAIRMYREQDLEQFEALNSFISGYSRDSIMLRRNQKMARRIDSLAHQRSIFFAIGAGHLPGDSGVVNMLRLKGFHLTPVRSDKTIAAATYDFKAREQAWQRNSSTNNLYSVEMPGVPQTTRYSSDNMEIKLYTDINTGLYYLSLNSVVNLSENEDSVLNTVLNNLKRKGEIVKSTSIVYDSVKGKEITAITGKYTYRIRAFSRPPVVYALLVGSDIQDSVESLNATRFFNSLVFNKTIKVEAPSQQTFTNTQHGFSILFPEKPSIRRNEEEETIVTTIYAASDAKDNMYLQCIVQDMKKGYSLKADSAVFDIYKSFLKKNATKIISTRYDTVQHFPAIWHEFIIARGGEEYYNKILQLHRGNRIYTLGATAADAVGSKKKIDEFFHSFTLQPLPEAVWSQHTSPDNSFSIWAPETVTYYRSKDSSENDPEIKIYYVHDSTAPVSFFIKKSAFNPYYWVESDSALLRYQANVNVGYSDSLISFKMVNNGNYKGAEALISQFDNHNLKKMRFLVVGDTLMLLYCVAPREALEAPNALRFFSGFSFTDQHLPTSVYTSKAVKLLDSLSSKDSITVILTKKILDLVKFAPSEMPLLHKATMRSYADSNNYNNTNNLLFNKVATLRDSSSIQFVLEQYASTSPNIEKYRYDLLYILSAYKTKAAYALIKDLLVQHPPTEGNVYRLFSRLMYDSLSLSAGILPGILPLLSDSVIRWPLISLSVRLMENDLVNGSTILPYKKLLYGLAEDELKKNRKADDLDDAYQYGSLLKLIGKMKDPAGYQLIKKYQASRNTFLQFSAVKALLKNNQATDVTALNKLGADTEYRISLYRELKELKKLSLFPVKYLTQQALSQSELYNYASEDYGVKKVVFIATRNVMYEGVKRKFYLYRIDVEADDDNVTSYLGVAGPFDLNATKPRIETNATGIYWHKEYDLKKIDALLNSYLNGEEEEEDDNTQDDED